MLLIWQLKLLNVCIAILLHATVYTFKMARDVIVNALWRLNVYSAVVLR